VGVVVSLRQAACASLLLSGYAGRMGTYQRCGSVLRLATLLGVTDEYSAW
jgi:hypothetical protein